MHWSPRKLSEYSNEQLQEVGQYSPAFFRYQEVLNKSADGFSAKLRQFRVQAWCELVAEIFIHKANPADICHKWSEVADEIILKAWEHSGLKSKALACFALGKLGSKELNLSSDIDLVIISKNPCPHETEVLIRNFIKELSEVTEFGFCFRVDLDLRPGGRFSPMVPSLSRIEDHYWKHGQTWERLALVRSRPLCGDEETIDSCQKIFTPFTYRKYINYSLFEDLKGLRSDIFQHRPKTKENEAHLKLMDGGIRDIELFVHALQVIHGGRMPDVRKTGTPEAIDALIENQYGDPEDLRFLKELYWHLRDAENRAQAREDSQTHVQAGSVDEIKKKTQQAAHIVSEILGKVHESTGLPQDEKLQKEWLLGLGYTEESIDNQWHNLVNLTPRSSRYAHDEEARQSVLRLFAEKLSAGIDPNLGLHYLYDFIKAVRAKSSFYTLFLHEPKLIDDLSRLFTTSPALSQIFVNRPELLDSFLFNTTDSNANDLDEKLEQLFEDKLLTNVRCSLDFLRTKKVEELENSLSRLADKTFEELLSYLKSEVPSEVGVLKMGKWAGQELGLQSDLDMVLISQQSVTQADYKLARRLISRVTENHRGGHFYQIDLRLRPTGSAGPLIMSEEQLLEYLRNKAEPWERQSYLRSRSTETLDKKIRAIILEKKFNKEELTQLRDIRLKLYKSDNDHLDLKYCPGGLLDIEFASQIAVIQNSAQFGLPSTRNMLTALGRNDLAQSYSRLRKIEQVLHLLTQTGASTLGKQGEEHKRLSHVLETSEKELFNETQQLLAENVEQLKKLDPIWGSD